MLSKKAKIIIGVVYGSLLAGFTALTMLETFAFPSASGSITSDSSSSQFNFDSSSNPDASLKQTTLSYEEKIYETSGKQVPYMLVKVNLKKTSDLRTKIATDDSGRYGTNITRSFSSLITSSEQEDGEEVLFAIDGDFPYWSGRNGYVVRNGQALRQSQRSDSSNLDLAFFKDGTFSTYDESQVSFSDLMNQNGGCYQNWSFGPALLVDCQIKVSSTQDVSQMMSANQRAAMGIQEDGTLYFLCSNTNDGKRKSSSVGLSLYHMASIFQELGCSMAYNFDGGGSAGMYIKGYGDYIAPSRNLGDIVYVVNS